MKRYLVPAIVFAVITLSLVSIAKTASDKLQSGKIAHNEQYITALQSQLESLTDRVEQLEGRE